MIEIKAVSKTIKKNAILKAVTLNIEGVYGLIGPNGAGKTTLMKILAGIHQSDAGSIRIDGEEFLRRKQVKNNELIGYLSQDFMVYPQVSVLEVLNHIGVLQGIKDKKERLKRIKEVLSEVNLIDQEHKKMVTLSGGQRRRVGIAQLLLREPSILMFDEPTAGLDIEERIRFRNLLKKLGQKHTVIISSHIVEDIDFLCNKIGVLKKGKIIFEGTPDQLKNKAEGKIYEAKIEKENIDSLLKNKEVVQITEQESEIIVRYYSTVEEDQAKLTVPRLIEGYLAIVKEG